ncbi:MAG: hypothetical protein RLZZ621_238, partial [Gemmatimonadota bacterium]
MARPAATAAEALPDTVMKQALRVFLDCQGWCAAAIA